MKSFNPENILIYQYNLSLFGEIIKIIIKVILLKSDS